MNASGQFQTILNNLGVQSKDVQVYPGVRLAHIINPSYVVEPSEAAISGAKFLSSTEQLKAGSKSAIMFINDLQSKNNAKPLSLQLNEVASKFKLVQQDANKSQEEDLPNVIKQETASNNDFEAYYRSIIDIQFSSRNLYTLATEINKEKDLSPDPDSNIISGLFGKIKSIVQKIITKIGQVINRLQGIAETFGKSITDLLGDFENILKQGPEAIINAFSSISDHFVQFMVTLTEQMFKFLTKFSSVADSGGYAISNIQIKIPSLKFEYVNMFQVSIPLPNIDPPEMTLTINRLGQTTTQG